VNTDQCCTPAPALLVTAGHIQQSRDPPPHSLHLPWLQTQVQGEDCEVKLDLLREVKNIRYCL